MIKRLMFTFVLLFLLGWFSNAVYSDISGSLDNFQNDQTGRFIANGNAVLKEEPSPMNRIEEEQIHVYNDRVVIDMKQPEWSSFTDTNSMDPVLDKGANAIHIVPDAPSDINIGDIVAYKSDYAEGTLIHRVVEVDADEKGIYYKLKGDNNPEKDPGKVRFEQIERVLVAVVY